MSRSRVTDSKFLKSGRSVRVTEGRSKHFVNVSGIGIIFCAVLMLPTQYWMYIKKEENGTSRVAEGSAQLSGLHSSRLVHTMHAMILFLMSLTPTSCFGK